MAMRIQLRRGTAAQWTAQNPVLAEGEAGVETDSWRIKFGDGVTPWTSIPYSTMTVADVEAATQAALSSDPIMQQAAASAVDEAIYDQGVITGLGVKRMIVSKDPLEPLVDGDLLILIDTRRYFTDFSADTTGVVPTGWTEPWITTPTWTVEADVSATGGKLLRAVVTGSGRNVLAWTGQPADSADMETVIRWRSTAVNSAGVKHVLRGAGAATGTTTGISVGGGNPYYQNIQYGYWSAGSFFEIGQMSGDPLPIKQNNVWYRSRLRVEGESIKYRVWEDGTSEPSVWHVDITSSVVTGAGWSGVYLQDAGTTDIDWVGLALDGGPAPQSAAEADL